jgi:hypothetical protein
VITPQALRTDIEPSGALSLFHWSTTIIDDKGVFVPSRRGSLKIGSYSSHPGRRNEAPVVTRWEPRAFLEEWNSSLYDERIEGYFVILTGEMVYTWEGGKFPEIILALVVQSE